MNRLSITGRAASLARRFAICFLLVLAAVLGVASTAQARVGEVKALPGFYGTATVAMDGTYSGRVWWDYSSGANCVYVQYKHVARLGLDATWNRLTANSCGPAYSGYWSQGTNRAFNGMAFRICQDKNNVPDPCGSSVTIYV